LLLLGQAASRENDLRGSALYSLFPFALQSPRPVPPSLDIANSRCLSRFSHDALKNSEKPFASRTEQSEPSQRAVTALEI
jgi:hypothetical protein